MKQSRSLYAIVNIIIRKFSHASLNTKLMLFRAYCTPICGCQLWSTMFQYLYGKLRDLLIMMSSYSYLLHKPRWCSASRLFVFHTVPSFTEIIRKLVYSLSCSPCNNCSFLLCSIVTYIYNHLCLIGGISCYVYFSFSLSLNFLNYGILCILYMSLLLT